MGEGSSHSVHRARGQCKNLTPPKQDFNQLIANGQWRNNKYCQLTLDGPHKTPVLVLVPRDIMSDDSAFNSLRATIKDVVSTWPGYKFAKYVAEDPQRYNHSLFILEQFLLIPKRCESRLSTIDCRLA